MALMMALDTAEIQNRLDSQDQAVDSLWYPLTTGTGTQGSRITPPPMIKRPQPGSEGQFPTSVLNLVPAR